MLVHGRPSADRDDGLWGWRAVTQSTVWPDGVVIVSPLLDDDLRLFEGIENLNKKEELGKSRIPR